VSKAEVANCILQGKLGELQGLPCFSMTMRVIDVASVSAHGDSSHSLELTRISNDLHKVAARADAGGDAGGFTHPAGWPFMCIMMGLE
jgi:hypothetical protein